MSSHDRLLKVLDLFDEEYPYWSGAEIVSYFGLTRSTTYRYIKTLCDFGFLEPVDKDRYMLGTRFIVMDRVIRTCDPILQVAEPEIKALSKKTGETITLTRHYRDQLVRIFMVQGKVPVQIGYDRGQLLSLFKGCTGKVILANLSWRELKKLYKKKKEEIATLGIGEDWDSFLKNVRKYSKNKSVRTVGEIFPGNMGIAAPIFSNKQGVLGSITLIIKESDSTQKNIIALAEDVEQTAKEISRQLTI